MLLSHFDPKVTNAIAKAHGLAKPAEILSHQEARAQLYQSARDDGWSISQIARAADTDVATVLRRLRKGYPELYPCRKHAGFPR